MRAWFYLATHLLFTTRMLLCSLVFRLVFYILFSCRNHNAHIATQAAQKLYTQISNTYYAHSKQQQNHNFIYIFILCVPFFLFLLFYLHFYLFYSCSTPSISPSLPLSFCSCLLAHASHKYHISYNQCFFVQFDHFHCLIYLSTAVIYSLCIRFYTYFFFGSARALAVSTYYSSYCCIYFTRAFRCFSLVVFGLIMTICYLLLLYINYSSLFDVYNFNEMKTTH